MRNVYTIQQCFLNKNEWICKVDEKINVKTLQPTGQVLTDTDNLAFVYLVVENGEYSYLQFPNNIWPSLLKVVQQMGKVFLQNNSGTMELINFANELEMLLFNIEGNGNYGENFVHAVENNFKSIFEGDI